MNHQINRGKTIYKKILIKKLIINRYFEQIVWPSYIKTLRNSKKLKRIKYYNISSSQPTIEDVYNMVIIIININKINMI